MNKKNKNTRRKSLFHCIILVMLLSSLSFAQTDSAAIREMLQNRFAENTIPAVLYAGGEILFASTSIPLFYERRAYEPVWVNERGLKPDAYQLIRTIASAEQEGLLPEEYHLQKIYTVLKVIPFNSGPEALVDLELLLTDAALIYGAHLLSGVVNPKTFDAEWHANCRTNVMIEVLQKAIAENRVIEMLSGLDPPQPGFARLREALTYYRSVAANGGWPTIAAGSILRKGDKGPRVAALRVGLFRAGDHRLYEPDTSDIFDSATEAAVRSFQLRHGLVPSGIFDAPTCRALNVPVEQRIRQILINMERWRWLPQDLGRRHITVNIANYRMDVVEDNRISHSQRVMVGKDIRQTTVFSDRITYLVLNPSWEVPNTIAVEDILPKVKRDPLYLSHQGMRLLRGWGTETEEINRDSVDWSQVTVENFNYRIRQDPGPRNALGSIKFMFPNKFSVYVHDTPSRSLFKKTFRSFSSGCIRTENALSLAVYVLSKDPLWKRKDIIAALKTGEELNVKLSEPIQVHLLYWTAWADEDGSIQFRNDIYGRDTLLYSALRMKPQSLLLGEK